MSDPEHAHPEHGKISLIEPERMNLLGLMLKSMLGRRLADPAARRQFQTLTGAVEIEAGGMQIALGFKAGELEIRRGKGSNPPVARIRGTLIALLDAALGRRRIEHFLRGELSAWGHPLVLWRLFNLVRVTEPPAKRLEA